MAESLVSFNGVWKKFNRGERHDSLRDLLPSLAKKLFGRREPAPLGTDEFWALRDVSFEVPRGEALGIIGRNGAGKSTTLKLLTRILKPTQGSCRVIGRVGAMIEVASGFHPDLTGRENVFLQGAIMGMDPRETMRRFDEIVEFAGVAASIDTPVKRYSSGMQARLGFAVAAHMDPEVLLIDEVLAVGDMSFQQKCYQRLLDFKRSGAAIVFVSHNMQAISMLSDRVLFLQPDGPPQSGSVGEMVSAYVTAGAKSADGRIIIERAALTKDDGLFPLETPIAPGTWLTLDICISAAAPFMGAGLAILVHRSDGLLIFNGSSIVDGEPPFDLLPGRDVRLKISFRANLLRGTYAVSGLLFEEHRQWPSVELGILGSFVVVETTRAAGITELEPRYLRCEPADSLPAVASPSANALAKSGV